MIGARVEVGVDRPYVVHIGRGLAAAALEEAGETPRVLLTDKNVEAAQLTAANPLSSLPRLSVEPGEGSKRLAELEHVLDFLAKEELDRASVVIAYGGGVVSDLGGLAAGLYQRGIDWIACPTTLLAQVDASVGGKTAVNLTAGKNLAGVFHQPRAVFVDIDVLATLPDSEFTSGLGEVLKSAWIGDAELLDWLTQNAAAIAARDTDALAWIVERCVRVKAKIVTEDERESGLRRALNLGHTFGHAIELVAGFGRIPHGMAVAVGIDLALRASEAAGVLEDTDWIERNARLLSALGLPQSLEHLRTTTGLSLDAEELEAAFLVDKKNVQGRSRWILLAEPGSPRIDCDLPASVLRELLA